jgi:LAO/AO transport system kinase
VNLERLNKILACDTKEAAILMRGIEEELPDALDALKLIYPHTGKAHIIGITGPPGAGKSTVADALIKVFRKKDLSIGVVAIDPTSPFTGGAVLGDRVRMHEHMMDKDVHIKSIATRGWTGGLAKTAMSIVHVMDAMGKDIVILETVGTGQSEVEITKFSDTSVLVLSPESGDQVQIVKAGILEAADIFVANKADKNESNYVVSSLELMLGLRSYTPLQWKPGIILTEAITGQGVQMLAAKIDEHREHLVKSGELEERRKKRAKEELIQGIETYWFNQFFQLFDEGGYTEALVTKVSQRQIDPHSAAMKILELMAQPLSHGELASRGGAVV